MQATIRANSLFQCLTFQYNFPQVRNLVLKGNADLIPGLNVTSTTESREIDFKPLTEYCPGSQNLEGVSVATKNDSDWNSVLAVIVINTPMASDYKLVSRKRYNQVFQICSNGRVFYDKIKFTF